MVWRTSKTRETPKRRRSQHGSIKLAGSRDDSGGSDRVEEAVIWIIVVLVLSAVAGGVIQRRHFKDRDVNDQRAWAEGLRVKELVIPVRLLASLLLAFVVVSVFGSYRNTSSQAANEAGAVLAMGEQAVLLSEPARGEVLGSLRCYTRAVAGPDWEAQAQNGALSPVTDAAADRINATLREATTDPQNASAVAAILDDDAGRIQARIQRSNEARPTVPNEVWVLMLVTVGVMIGSSAALAHPGVSTSVQYALLAGTTLVFGLTLLITYDIGRPFDGFARVNPTAMQNVDHRLANLPGGSDEPPCDADGRLR